TEEQPLGPQSDRTGDAQAQQSVVVSGGAPARLPQTRSQSPGLQARMAAAKLLAAVIDRKTPLDGLTDAEHGNPAFMALEQRDRGLVRAILATALRFRGTIEALVAARLDRPIPPNAHSLGHILHVAAAQM